MLNITRLDKSIFFKVLLYKLNILIILLKEINSLKNLLSYN